MCMSYNYYQHVKNTNPEKFREIVERNKAHAKRSYYSKTKSERSQIWKTDDYRKKRKKIRAAYRQRHPFWRSARNIKRKIADSTISALDLWKLCLKQRCRCALTNDKLTAETLSVDHIVPLSHGGTNTINNIQLTTINANLAKHSMPQSEFIALCKKIVDKSST